MKEAPRALPFVMMAEAPEELFEVKAHKLRRAATALLVCSVLRFGHLEGFLGMFAAVTVLCAPSANLTGTACRVKSSAILAGGFACMAAVACVAMVVIGMPERIGQEVEGYCVTMPADTFEWGKNVVAEQRLRHQHHHFQHTDGGDHHFQHAYGGDDHHHHHHDDPPMHLEAMHLEAKLALVPPPTQEQAGGVVQWIGRRALQAVAMIAQVPEQQEQMCAKLAHCIGVFGSVLLCLGAILEFTLCISAVLVAKRACALARREQTRTAAISAQVVIASQ